MPSRMAGRGVAEELAVEIRQGGKQRDGAVPDTVVGAGAHVADAQRQAGLAALQSLALALLVAAQDQGLVRRLQVKPDNVPELGLDLRITRQLEGPAQARLDVGRLPDALHRGLRHTGRLRHAAHRPALPSRRRLRGPDHDLRLHRRDDRRLAAAALGVGQAGQIGAPETLLPKPDHRPVDLDPCRLRLAQT